MPLAILSGLKMRPSFINIRPSTLNPANLSRAHSLLSLLLYLPGLAASATIARFFKMLTASSSSRSRMAGNEACNPLVTSSQPLTMAEAGPTAAASVARSFCLGCWNPETNLPVSASVVAFGVPRAAFWMVIQSCAT